VGKGRVRLERLGDGDRWQGNVHDAGKHVFFSGTGWPITTGKEQFMNQDERRIARERGIQRSGLIIGIVLGILPIVLGVAVDDFDTISFVRSGIIWLAIGAAAFIVGKIRTDKVRQEIAARNKEN
jgi:hypothetical protein